MSTATLTQTQVTEIVAEAQAAARQAALDLQVCEVDLVESMGYMLVRCDDEPEDFVKRVMKKPVMMVDSWI